MPSNKITAGKTCLIGTGGIAFRMIQRIGKIKSENQNVKFNQKLIFENKKNHGDFSRINFPYPKILKKLKKEIKF